MQMQMPMPMQIQTNWIDEKCVFEGWLAGGHGCAVASRQLLCVTRVSLCLFPHPHHRHTGLLACGG